MVDRPDIFKALEQLAVCPLSVTSVLYQEHLAQLCPEWPALLLFGKSAFDELVLVDLLELNSPTLCQDIESRIGDYRNEQSLLENSVNGNTQQADTLKPLSLEECFEIPIVVGIGELQ